MLLEKRIAQVLQRNVCKLFANNPSKEICTFLFFLIKQQVILNFAKIFAYFKWHGQGLLKSKYFIIFWTFFCKHFYYIAEFGKKIQILQNCNFSADSKSKAKKAFLMMYH